VLIGFSLFRSSLIRHITYTSFVNMTELKVLITTWSGLIGPKPSRQHLTEKTYEYQCILYCCATFGQ
jgi:hypothetical protein